MAKLIFLFILSITSLFSQTDYSMKKIKLIGQKKDNISKKITIKEIEKINLVDFILLDPYTKVKTKYSGVLLTEFINTYAKKDINKIIFKAIDGYEVEIEKKEWSTFTILLATRLNDENVGYENKGPLRIVFPKYDIASENYANNLPKWIWMINTIEFK